ncbi:MAG: hypothetical protein IPJ65_15675 [Archangiaceae bacterium]|nr:hypothetical protein [Archangiaceae bacterium]
MIPQAAVISPAARAASDGQLANSARIQDAYAENRDVEAYRRSLQGQGMSPEELRRSENQFREAMGYTPAGEQQAFYLRELL